MIFKRYRAQSNMWYTTQTPDKISQVQQLIQQGSCRNKSQQSCKSQRMQIDKKVRNTKEKQVRKKKLDR